MKRGLVTPVRCLACLLFACCALLLPHRLFADSGTSPWFKPSDPEFSVRQDAILDTDYPSTVGGRGNVDCQTLTFTKREGQILSTPLHLYKESKMSGCFVDTAMGEIDSNGYVNVGGTDYIAEMVDNNGQPHPVSVFPDTDVFVSNTSSSPAVGLYVWFDHLQTSMKLANMPNGRILAVIQPHNETPLADKNGNKLAVMADNFSVSDNAKWAVVDSPGKALMRINLNTMEVLPFTNSFEYGNGIGAAIRMAVSSDGRYVAVASKNYNYFKLFDLSTCDAVPNTITAPVSGCQSRDLYAFTASKISGFTSILQMRFLTDDLIKFYASYKVTSTSAIGEFVVAAPNTYLTGMDYLAMGDSFASGEGAQKYEIGTDEHNLNTCHLSRVSYPYAIARSIQANNFHSVACSGARTVNIQGGSGYSKDKSKKDRDNQFNREEEPSNNSLGDWLPGYKKQISFISINNPAIVTLSVGGNDIGFKDKLISCIEPGTCFPTYEDRQEVFNEIDGKLNTLTGTFKKAKDYATKNARIYIIGYPQIAFADGNCGLNVHLNHDELVFASSVITRLNQVIKTAAVQAGVSYIDVEDALNGYRLCENNAGNMAMNGLTAGNDIFGVVGAESYHPNEFGHELMANKILGATNNFAVTDPPADPAATLEKAKDTDPALKDTPKTGRTLNRRVSAPASTKTATKSKKTKVSVKGVDYGLAPTTSYSVTVGGSPAGSVASDENGDIDTEITIPDGTQTGPTTIDIIGPDITDQPVDVSTSITVGNDGPDFDGDGTLDTEDTCPVVTNAFVDVDQDNVDDACDPLIGPAPMQLPPDDKNLDDNTEQSTPDNLLPSDPNNKPTVPDPAGETASPPQGTTTTSNPVERSTTTTSLPGQNDKTALADTSQTGQSKVSFDPHPQTSGAIQQTPNKQSGKVLGKVTDIPSASVPADLGEIARTSLQEQASTHPVRFLLIILSLMFTLLGLGILHHRRLPKAHSLR